MTGNCKNCGAVGVSLHSHHVVPKSSGGQLTVDLCESCHGLVHGRGFLHHTNLTKEGLRKAKQRGVKLGTPANLTREAQLNGSIAMKKAAREAVVDIAPIVIAMKNEGNSLRKIAAALTETGYTTRTGKPWNPVQVSRVMSYA